MTEATPAPAAASAPGGTRRLLAGVKCFAVEQAGPLGAALLGFLVFLAIYGPAALNPMRIGWLIRDDFSQHLLGWLFFRNAPLGLPLGAIPGYLHPLGTTLGYTDSLPWVGLLLRPFSALLPADFQYIGPWLCLCLVLQGAVAAWVARRMGATVTQQWLIGALLVLSPALLARMSMSHDALSAHWLVVLMVGLHLIPQRDAREAKRALGCALGLCVLASGIHPVLAVMVLALSVSLCVRTALEGQAGWRWPVLAAVASVAAVALFLTAFGYFSMTGPLAGYGFGEFSSDLATFFNPFGYRDLRWSRFLPSLGRGRGQYEGFGYLGVGGLFALGSALVLSALRARHVGRLWRRWLPVALVGLGLAFFALSWRITWLGGQVADVSALYRPALKWVEAFRASGRFVWPLYYFLLLGSALALLRLPRPAVAPLLLALGLTLQVLDVDLGRGHQAAEGTRWSGPSDALREAARGRKHLVLYPPQSYDGSGHGCRAGPMDFERWAYRAYRLGLTFNGGYVARLDDRRAQAYCLGLDDEIRAGRLDPETVYLSIPQRLHELRAIPGTRCTEQEGLWMCVLDAARPAP